MRIATLWLFTLLCGGCIGTMDSVSVVRGQLVRDDGADLNGCLATPYRSGTKELLSKYERTVDARFFVSLVNAPTSGKAFIEFRCPGVANPIRSPDFSLAAASEPDGVDVGRVVAGQ